MKLDDPFGRSAGKQERDYQALKATLQDAGIVTPAAVAALRRNVVRNGLVAALLVALVVGCTAAFFPHLLGFVTICAVVVGIWVVASTARGRAHLARYIDELGQP